MKTPLNKTSAGGEGENHGQGLLVGKRPAEVREGLTGEGKKGVKLPWMIAIGVVMILGLVMWRMRGGDGGGDGAKEGRAVVVGKAELVFVEGGALPADSKVPEKRVGRFWMGKYEVTWGEWQEVREWAVKKGYELEEGSGGGKKYPVTEVNWYSVVKWCNARSEKEGLMAVYVVRGAVYQSGESVPTVKGGANGYRLPSEGEWEWAARGGVKGRGYEYSGSNDLGEVGWYRENSGKKTHEVGTKKSNELGIDDMSGNVWEWCFDRWGYKGTYRVMRGGSWDYSANHARVSSQAATGSSNVFGLRVVRSSVP